MRQIFSRLIVVTGQFYRICFRHGFPRYSGWRPGSAMPTDAAHPSLQLSETPNIRSLSSRTAKCGANPSVVASLCSLSKSGANARLSGNKAKRSNGRRPEHRHIIGWHRPRPRSWESQLLLCSCQGGLALGQGNVKVSFTLLNWIHNSRLSKNPPFPPFEKGRTTKSPFVKGDLEGFSSTQHDFDETLGARKFVLT
jgi:hypothetical protein